MIPTAPAGLRAGCGRAHSMVVAAALACGLSFAGATSSPAGTVVRGRVDLPPSASVKNSEGAHRRETVDARDAVVYVTEEPGGKGTKLAGRASRREIQLDGDRFMPQVLPVMAGSRVRFRNRDRVYHSVFSVSPAGRFNLGNLAPGKKRENRFDGPGVVNLFCELHPTAAGFVVVCPNWYFTRVGASGEYVLPPLPRGSYVLHAWHPRLGATRRSVEVTGRDVLAVNLGY